MLQSKVYLRLLYSGEYLAWGTFRVLLHRLLWWEIAYTPKEVSLVFIWSVSRELAHLFYFIYLFRSYAC